MRSLLSPKWLFILNSLPIALLFFLYYGQFSIIKSLLNEESIKLWKSFAIALGTLGILNFLYATCLSFKQQKVSAYYGLIALIAYTIFIYLYGVYLDKIIPFSIPRWMMPGNLFLYAGTFLMPTLAYALFVLVVHSKPKTERHQALKNFLVAMLIPISWYLFVQLILPFWQRVESHFDTHVLLVLAIASIIVFFFLLVRAVYILFFRSSKWWKSHQLVLKIPIAIVLPVIGLLLNNGYFFGEKLGVSNSGIFGDFNSTYFYVLAILNGLFLCLPNLENKHYRICLFFGRGITLAYTFYFFMVFLPFLPLSVFAIIVAGVGFLMLTPLALMMLHIKELSTDFNWLKKYYTSPLLWILSLIAFLLIPSIITVNYVNDRNTLYNTLAYLDQPDYSKLDPINKTSLQKTIGIVKEHKRRNRDFLFGKQMPYLSTYFNWLVLNNLTLSDKKINTIEKVFFGKTTDQSSQQFSNPKDDVQITNMNSSSVYDASQQAWKSWVDLEITNNENRDFREYATTFNLPEGTWISDYYLYVGDRKEHGMLSEKKTAMWVYSNITSRRRDPGILYYLTGNRVAFRVFPFAKKEVRKTGIEILHKEPIELIIDNKQIKLGGESNQQYTAFENGQLAYIPAHQKSELNPTFRKPYFHFIVDCTSKENNPALTDRIERVIEQYPDLVENASISFVNSYVNTYSFETNWKQQFNNQTFEGGFYIDRAIKSVLYDAHQTKTATYPVIVVVTDYIEEAVFGRDFSDWQFTFPEGDSFYNLKENDLVDVHSLSLKPNKPTEENVSISFNHPVLEYRFKDQAIAYLPNNNKASLIVKPGAQEKIDQDFKHKDWESAATMQANWLTHILHPEKANRTWLSLVKQSFQTQVMTPVTSFLALENEAQKAMLKKKQEQVLASNHSLELGEEVQRMSEPGLLLLGLLLLLFLHLKRKRILNKFLVRVV